jgi:hypothetical protein
MHLQRRWKVQRLCFGPLLRRRLLRRRLLRRFCLLWRVRLRLFRFGVVQGIWLQ